MTQDKTKHVRIRGWTMNNLNNSPNEEGNRLNRLTDSTDDGLSVLSIMNWWWDTRRNRNTCGFSVRRLLTTTASKLSSLVMAFLIRFRRPSTPSCIGINTILTCFLCDGDILCNVASSLISSQPSKNVGIRYLSVTCRTTCHDMSPWHDIFLCIL